MDLVITIRNPHEPRQAFGYFDNSVRGFSTDERRAMSFNDMDEASVPSRRCGSGSRGSHTKLM